MAEYLEIRVELFMFNKRDSNLLMQNILPRYVFANFIKSVEVKPLIISLAATI